MNVIGGIDLPGMSNVPTKIHTGGNSGFQAINLAALWGVRRIVLLGYDVKATDGRRHFHVDHPEHLGNPLTFGRWAERFNVAARDLRGMGIQVVNCSEQTALTCFEKMSLADALSDV